MGESSTADVLKADNDFFKQMIGLVPTQFYAEDTSYSEDDEEEEVKLTDKQAAKRKKGQEIRIAKKVKMEESEETGASPGGEGKKSKKLKRKPAAKGIDELRHRLQSKIDGMRAQRKAKEMSQEDKQKLRKELSKDKKKQTTNARIKIKKPISEKKVKVNGESSAASTRPAFNKDGQLVFSRFDFSQTEDEIKKKKKKGDSGKNYKKMLETVTKQKEKLTKLKEVNPEGAKAVAEKAKWMAALQRSEGLKVRDDPEKLKKAIKRKEKKKEKSKKNWADRKEGIDKKLKDRLDKRDANIDKRKQSNKDNKIKKLTKRGRIVPGF
ncbi:hypothetical protein CAPTEDRAFT_226563 [Capitella teleta]|uniref:Ribosomal RNA-processing protein 14/surfeit locus protein 6 C-terminal domain-containing protein n=1 Tax=Capitella teleta TaxID=283909 RepID=R7TRQ3_CAPTE|nr:hypothetical protein CAPTEDRAFT_226563 [Capitella teleta]|eukprot:ELT96262.1 hypothetical protein CAPTEDRAFT_226563 [Capitella teleta]